MHLWEFLKISPFSPSIVDVGGRCVVVVALVAGCGSECDRQGCASLQQAAVSSEIGIAGVIATESDAVVDGCAECGFGQSTVQVWDTPSQVTTKQEARAIVKASAPMTIRAASGLYELPLQAGSYLLCTQQRCVSVLVETEAVTVNIWTGEGPERFFVASGALSAPTEVPGFDVGF